MRKALFILSLFGSLGLGAAAYAEQPGSERLPVQPVYWSGDYGSVYCGPRCQEHRWWRHRRWEARRHEWHRRHWEGRHWEGRHWEERRYGYNPYSRY